MLFVKLVFDAYIAHALLLFYHPESLMSLHTHSVIKYKYAELPYLWLIKFKLELADSETQLTSIRLRKKDFFLQREVLTGVIPPTWAHWELSQLNLWGFSLMGYWYIPHRTMDGHLKSPPHSLRMYTHTHWSITEYNYSDIATKITIMKKSSLPGQKYIKAFFPSFCNVTHIGSDPFHHRGNLLSGFVPIKNSALETSSHM